ncbi:MAG: hypothetical protein HDR25_08620 [Lachnospiraceae bacterium]|nr:hypothetical protein [Lachnospiraceae bacterium]
MFFKTLISLIIIIAVLIHPETTFEYAYAGLYQWAVKMVPTLFPFMMISSIMVYSGADLELGRILSVLLKRIYRYSVYGLYAVFMGFFCGFPMGAKVVSELYENQKLSKEEAISLLGFCNNIGPAYFLGIIIPILHACGYQNTLPFLFGMYGIPALYGIVLSRRFAKENPGIISFEKISPSKPTKHLSLTNCLKRACTENTQSLIMLGGYITFTNVFRIFLDFFGFSNNIKRVLSSFLEIMGGVQTIYTSTLYPKQKILWIMTALSFSGISCLIQTSSFLEKAKLPLAAYIKNRVILTMISLFYYIVLIYAL